MFAVEAACEGGLANPDITGEVIGGFKVLVVTGGARVFLGCCLGETAGWLDGLAAVGSLGETAEGSRGETGMAVPGCGCLAKADWGCLGWDSNGETVGAGCGFDGTKD